jgi:hypothetical protein
MRYFVMIVKKEMLFQDIIDKAKEEAARRLDSDHLGLLNLQERSKHTQHASSRTPVPTRGFHAGTKMARLADFFLLQRFMGKAGMPTWIPCQYADFMQAEVGFPFISSAT